MFSSDDSMAVISRKKAGLFRHVGVLLPDGRVAHCSPERGEHISSVEEFADGRDVTIERAVPPTQYSSTFQRIASAMRSPQGYALMTNNCEMFANRMTGRKEESPQLHRAAIAVGVAALLVLAVTR